jgi:hypothetical protein
MRARLASGAGGLLPPAGVDATAQAAQRARRDCRTHMLSSGSGVARIHRCVGWRPPPQRASSDWRRSHPSAPHPGGQPAINVARAAAGLVARWPALNTRSDVSLSREPPARRSAITRRRRCILHAAAGSHSQGQAPGSRTDSPVARARAPSGSSRSGRGERRSPALARARPRSPTGESCKSSNRTRAGVIATRAASS